MTTIRLRKEARTLTNLPIRSVDLPGLVATAADLSASGVRVIYPSRRGNDLKVGDSVRFQVAEDSLFSRFAEGYARVVWIRPGRERTSVGLVFERVGSGSRAFLETLMAA